MGVELTVTECNLTLVPQPPDNGATIALSLDDFAEVMRKPIIAADGETVVSVRDQISLVLKPPILGITDHSGAGPERSELISAATVVNELFVGRGFAIQAYGWNIEGSVIGIEPHEVLSRLVSERRIAHALGDDVWSPAQVTIALTSETDVGEEFTVSLLKRTELDRTSELAFNVNVHRHTSPNFRRIGTDGVEIWSAANDAISRLIDQSQFLHPEG